MERFHFFALLWSGVLISGVLGLQSTNFSIDCETMSTNLTKPEESASPYHLLISSENITQEVKLKNSTLIHKSSDEKYNVTSVWISPEAKKVQFIATVFQDPERYWVVISNKILFPRDSSVTGNDNEVADVAKETSASSRSRKK
ncbi:hypothetical protein E2320_010525, partial [Naja naja]